MNKKLMFIVSFSLLIVLISWLYIGTYKSVRCIENSNGNQNDVEIMYNYKRIVEYRFFGVNDKFTVDAYQSMPKKLLKETISSFEKNCNGKFSKRIILFK